MKRQQQHQCAEEWDREGERTREGKRHTNTRRELEKADPIGSFISLSLINTTVGGKKRGQQMQMVSFISLFTGYEPREMTGLMAVRMTSGCENLAEGTLVVMMVRRVVRWR